jgi:hypothetical protein
MGTRKPAKKSECKSASISLCSTREGDGDEGSNAGKVRNCGPTLLDAQKVMSAAITIKVRSWMKLEAFN